MKKRLEGSVVILESSQISPGTKSTHEIGTCNKFILVDDYNGMKILPLSMQHNSPTSGKPKGANINICQFNTNPAFLAMKRMSVG